MNRTACGSCAHYRPLVRAGSGPGFESDMGDADLGRGVCDAETLWPAALAARVPGASRLAPEGAVPRVSTRRREEVVAGCLKILEV